MSPSSSPVQDTGLSRRRQGFESPWGRHVQQGISGSIEIHARHEKRKKV